jgi:hypothetical protein
LNQVSTCRWTAEAASFAAAEVLSAPELLASSGLDESRLDMASGWLQTKGLLDVQERPVTSFVIGPIWSSDDANATSP